jgi:hypothetical protein
MGGLRIGLVSVWTEYEDGTAGYVRGITLREGANSEWRVGMTSSNQC